jgi:hypothetical protein
MLHGKTARPALIGWAREPAALLISTRPLRVHPRREPVKFRRDRGETAQELQAALAVRTRSGLYLNKQKIPERCSGIFLVIIGEKRASLVAVMDYFLFQQFLGATEEFGKAGYAHVAVGAAVDKAFMKPYFVARKLLFTLLAFCHYASTTFARNRRQE